MARGAQKEEEKDELFLSDAAPARFAFDDKVARVFSDMLRRSIPGYSTLLQMIGVLAHETVTDGSVIYDLGSSLGAASLAVRHAVGERNVRIVAVDNSEAMVQRSKEIMSADSSACPVDVLLGDVKDVAIDNASIVILNFTLQFLPPNERDGLLRKVFQGLRPGGYLVLSEKTLSTDTNEADTFRFLHDAFRRANGYSQLELSRKRQALEQVLISESRESYESRLTQAGFTTSEWFRALHFSSYLCRKS